MKKRNINALKNAIAEAQKEIEDFTPFLECMAANVDRFGEHPKFPHIAHETAVRYALEQYDGLLSAYASLNFERLDVGDVDAA